MENKLNKSFRFNAAVYVVECGDFGGFRLVKGRVCGVREYKTSYSSLIYLVETQNGRIEYLPSNIYESAEEFIEDAKQRIVS